MSGEKDKTKVRLEEMKELLSEDDSFSSTQSPATASLHCSASLNPHKALMQASVMAPVSVEEKQAPMLSTESVQAIRGVVGRDRTGPKHPLSLRKRGSEGDNGSSIPDDAPVTRRERASSSASERKKRSSHIADSFLELERLLQLKSESKSRAELVEEGVNHIKELQRCVNEAGERNSELHDMVESMQSRQAKQDLKKSSKEAAQAWALFKSIETITHTDLGYMLTAGALANMAPAEWQETLKKGSGSVPVTLQGVVRAAARLCVGCVAVVCIYRMIRRSKMMSVVRWLIYSSLTGDTSSPVSPGRSTSLTSSSSSAHTHRAHVAHPHPMSSLRKIYSAEDMDCLPTQNGGYRARATSNPVIPLCMVRSKAIKLNTANHPAKIISPHR